VYQSQVWLNVDDVISGEITLTAHLRDRGSEIGWLENLVEKQFDKLPQSLTGYDGSNPLRKREAMADLIDRIGDDRMAAIRHTGAGIGTTGLRLLDALDLTSARAADPFHRGLLGGMLAITGKRTFDPTTINPFTTLMVVSEADFRALDEDKVRAVLKATTPDVEPSKEDIALFFEAQDFLLKKHLNR